jgi:hypothetical protein
MAMVEVFDDRVKGMTQSDNSTAPSQLRCGPAGDDLRHVDRMARTRDGGSWLERRFGRGDDALIEQPAK